MIFNDIGNQKTTPKFLLFCLFLSVAILSGCLGGMQTTATQPETAEATSTAETETPTALAALHLSTSKTNYTAKEAIPLELNIQNGKFGLLVPFFSVATRGRVYANNCDRREPDRLLNRSNRLRKRTHRNMWQGTMENPSGVSKDLNSKASANEKLTLKDIQKYYLLQPGTYTVTLSIALEVYTESITEEHPEIRELKQDMAAHPERSEPSRCCEAGCPQLLPRTD